MFSAAPDILSLGSGASPSLSFNNLSVDAGLVAYAHKTSVFTFLEASARSIGVLPTKMGYRDSNPVLQVRWCHAGTGTPLLVLATTAGFQIWDSTGKSALFTYAFPDGFCRGVGGSDESGKLFVGSSTGKVFVASGTSPISLAGTFDAHSSGVTSLDVVGRVVATSSDAGDVSLWDTTTYKNLAEFPGAGGYPCTSVKLREAYVIAGFATGHIRLFDIKSSSMVVEIAAHARCITAIDAHLVQDTFVSAGEDAVVNVWTLPERSTGSYKVELAASKLVEDHLFTGVQFFKSPRLAILAASYDNNVMVLLQ